ncbi:hypothetical protein F1D05_06240 [Kribbella qitaiheensis]|uniref:Uncharacterized protein n=1 Tax=Kribbella qitaiheensis TaxID=1544730 RepID=A0A7G6WUB5_9ACTN|nr:hypothetical protein [Kribbella qitaiheensis]QNE17580.1 hypothetical protein F1D05_06240 [Kribbella qitaiheensis]
MTHTGMETDAPTEPNAVRSLQTRGVMEGFAELRTVNDFELFSAYAGYPGLELREPQYPGAYTTVDNLVEQVSGPAKDRAAFITQATHGPAAMHFDQLADSVVRNRLAAVVPARSQDQQAVRAALIATLMHPEWPSLPEASAHAGNTVAEKIRPVLNAKVDEFRHHYRANPHQPFPADSPNQYAVRLMAEGPGQPPQVSDGEREQGGTARGVGGLEAGMRRFLSGLARATRPGPALGDGSRGAGAPVVPAIGRSSGTPERG